MKQRPHRRQALLQLGGVALAGWSLARDGWAVMYLQPDEAKKLLLPGSDRFAIHELVLDAKDREAIERASGSRIPRVFAPEVWCGFKADQPIGWVCFDRVIGKYDYIDYAVGFDALNTVTGVEILTYRESYGAEIRNARWRAQFAGRKAPDTMRFDSDIRNISGATLSSRHVTEGVQRLSALVLTVLNRKEGGPR